MSERRFLVWSNATRSWWRPCRMGYTNIIGQAGRYPRDIAEVICADANECLRGNEPNAVMVQAPEDIDQGGTN